MVGIFVGPVVMAGLVIVVRELGLATGVSEVAGNKPAPSPWAAASVAGEVD